MTMTENRSTPHCELHINKKIIKIKKKGQNFTEENLIFPINESHTINDAQETQLD
jgi:hypothetical protein